MQSHLQSRMQIRPNPSRIDSHLFYVCFIRVPVGFNLFFICFRMKLNRFFIRHNMFCADCIKAFVGFVMVLYRFLCGAHKLYESLCSSIQVCRGFILFFLQVFAILIYGAIGLVPSLCQQ